MIAGEQLTSIVSRVERLEEEGKSINGDKSKVYKEAKSSGFDVKVIKRIVARRRKDPSAADEEDALYETYMQALHGTIDATRAPAREAA